MAFATNNDLQTYTPDIFDQGVDDWTDELALAETDVANFVNVKFWSDRHTTTSFDKTLLVEEQWTRATVYRALTAYILPKLATFRIDDVFIEQIKFYKERYAEEMDLQFALGIKYDYDEDATVQEDEVVQYTQDRLYR